MDQSKIDGYRWESADLNSSHDYLLPTLIRELKNLQVEAPDLKKQLFDLGCGNGSVANFLSQRGWDVIGVDPSCEGIPQCQDS